MVRVNELLEPESEAVTPAVVNQPSSEPTRKMSTLGLGGGVLLAVLASLKARGVNLLEEDIALLVLVVPWVIGYFTKERRR